MRMLLLLALITHVFTQGLFFNFFPLDMFGGQLSVSGAQPDGFQLQVRMTGPATLSAGTTITISTPGYASFRTPSGAWAEKVARFDQSKPGHDCLAHHTAGTLNTMVWTLGLLNGACELPSGSIWVLVVPADFAQLNPPPPAATYSVILTVSGVGQQTSTNSFTGYGIIYVTVDPRNADNSASYLVGAGQPRFLNVGFTATGDVTAGAMIHLDSSYSSLPMFFLPGFFTYAIPITGTGCTASLTSTGFGPTTMLSFALTGATCLIARNVAVASSQFSLPGALLGAHPVSKVVKIAVTITVGSQTYGAGSGNPGAYITTDGCNAWSAWSSCSKPCGSGYTYHTRTANAVCGSGYEERVCNTVACGCTPWGAWGACSATCGGTVSRYRTGSSDCNVSTVDTQPCGPANCSCPWTQTACSSKCGSGVRTRTVTPVAPGTDCDALNYDVVCDEPFTTESLACSCKDLDWQDRFGSTCVDYVDRQWCTSTGGYGPGWNFSKPGFRSFEYRASNGNTALSACCGCGKNRCVKDTILLIDQTMSIKKSDWKRIHQYIRDRVSLTPFSDEYGNRVAVLQFETSASVLCPLTWNRTFLLQCIEAITFPAGLFGETSVGLDLAYTVFDRYSSRNRTRVVELLTDGLPSFPNTRTAVAIQRTQDSAYVLKDAGVTILTIAVVHNCFSFSCPEQDVLASLASDPKSSYAVLLPSFSSLDTVLPLVSSQCQPKFGFDPSPSPLPKHSPDPSASLSPAASPTASASHSPRASPSPPASTSWSPRASASPTAVASASPSASPSASASPGPSASPAASPAGSPSPSASTSPSPRVSVSLSPWPSQSPWPSASPSISPLPSPSPDANALCQAQLALIPTEGWLKQDLWGCDEASVALLLLQFQCVQLEPKCPSFRCSLPVPPSVVLQIQTTCNSIKP